MHRLALHRLAATDPVRILRGMKSSILTLTVCLLAAACTAAPDAKEEPTQTAAATGERVQPEIRYYEASDT
jgi:starvation-inducible outer membrane lipoprotein